MRKYKLDVDRRLKTAFVWSETDTAECFIIIASYHNVSGVKKSGKGVYGILSNGKPIGVACHIDKVVETW